MFPLTFIAYSLFVYRKETTMRPIVPFSIGLLIDLLSGSYLGINAILFMLITYLINLYANAFKLFSYLQICIFFSFSATAYVGFVQLALNTNCTQCKLHSMEITLGANCIECKLH